MSRPRPKTGTAARGGLSLGARFVVLAMISLALVVVDHRDDRLSRVREYVTLAVYPIHVLVDLPFATWRSLTGAVASRGDLMRDNALLRRQLVIAQYRLQNLGVLERENDRLRQLLETSEQWSDDRVLIAEILSVDLDPYRQRFIINRGSADGVYVGQPLLDAAGIVGQVESVSVMTAEALLITDPDHAVPVAVERNGLRTIAEGTGDSRLLRLPYLPNSAEIVPGDRLVTSGLGGIFPSGRPVAIVEEVEERPDRNFAYVTARPVAALDRDQELLLVWSDLRLAVDESLQGSADR